MRFVTLREFREATKDLPDDAIIWQANRYWMEEGSIGIKEIKQQHVIFHENGYSVCVDDDPASGEGGWTRSEAKTIIHLEDQ